MRVLEGQRDYLITSRLCYSKASARYSNMKVRTLIIGAGAGASYFLVGLERARETGDLTGVPLARHLKYYRPEDIEVIGLVDVEVTKVGSTARSIASKLVPGVDPPKDLDGLVVQRGLHCGSLKGLPVKAMGLEEVLGSVQEAFDQFIALLDELRPDVVVNAITTEPLRYAETEEEFASKASSCQGGATMAYAYAVAEHSRRSGRHVAFINLTPPPIANSPGVVSYYARIGSLVLGDDAATGATPLTADILEHMAERERRVLSIAQFNIGGNSDFLSLVEPERNYSKEITKGAMVKDILGYDAPHYIKPTGYLEPLGDRKFVAMHIEYEGFGGFRDEIAVSARINDKSNLAGLIASVIPVAKGLVDRGISGTHATANRFFMKLPGPKDLRITSKIVAYYDLLEELRRLDLAT